MVSNHLQLRQNLLGTTDRDLARALLVLSIDDLAVVEDHSPASVPVTHTRSPTIVLAEESLGIAKEQNLVTLDAIDLAPCVHDPAVVGGNGCDDVDALVGEGFAVLDVGGEMVGLAAALYC
jgi:hypothetical protein